MHHDSLTIGVRHQPGYMLLTAAGENGIFTAARLRRQLCAQSPAACCPACTAAPVPPEGDDDDDD